MPSSVGLAAPGLRTPTWEGTDSQIPLSATAFGHVEVAGEEVVAARGKDHAAAGLAGGVERLLKGGRVVGLAVAFGAEVNHGEGIRRGAAVSARAHHRQKMPHAVREPARPAGFERYRPGLEAG